MDPRKLSLVLVLGGAAITLISIVWFVAAFASTLDMLGRWSDVSACLYSNPAICQGAAFFSDGPAYSPVVFWIGVISLLAGVIVFFTLAKQQPPATSAPGQTVAGSIDAPSPPQAASASSQSGAPVTDNLLGIIPKEKYARITYILMLVGAGAGLIISPLSIVAFAGFVLAILGAFVFPQHFSLLENRHFKYIGVVCLIAFVLILLSLGSALFLLLALLQLFAFYIGFTAFRAGRVIDGSNIVDEAKRPFEAIRARLQQRGKDGSEGGSD